MDFINKISETYKKMLGYNKFLEFYLIKNKFSYPPKLEDSHGI